MKTRSLLLLTLIGCAETPPAPTGTIVGRVDPLTLDWVSRVDAVGAGQEVSSALDDRNAFALEVEIGRRYQLALVDERTERSQLVVFPDGTDEIAVDTGTPVDLGAIFSRADQAESEGPSDEPEAGGCNTGECRFDTYNLEVQVGDRFVLTNFLGCDGQVGADFFFAYEDDETWNLDAFNSDGVVEITEADKSGGNHGEGEYRVFLFDAAGEELDHMTIRIGHGEESDIQAGDDAPPVRAPAGECTDPNDGDDGDNSGPGDGTVDDVDGDGTPDDQDPDVDGDGIPNDQDPDADGDGVLDDGNGGTETCTANEDCLSGVCANGICSDF